MHSSQRALSGEEDLRAMEDLARATCINNLHVTDLPWRLCSWVVDTPENFCLYRDGTGCLVAWAMLCTPFESLDYVCLPEVESDTLPEILSWVDERSRAHPEIVPRGTPEGKPCWFTDVFADHEDRIRLLEAVGFADQSDVGEYSWSKVFMERPGDLPVNESHIPAGFTIRPLNGEAEVDAYVQLHRETFGSKNMTRAWRTRIIHHPDYTPELDLVVEAQDGRLTAFCVCWFDQETRIGHIEPLGSHPDFRHHSLGRAVLSEGLRRLQEHGAKQVFVETDNWRNAALELYKSIGFQVVRDVLVYRKDY